MAYNLKIEVARRDPVKEFPPEVMGMIFALLTPSDIRYTTRLVPHACHFLTRFSRCLRVNKQWSQVISRDSMLWTDLRLGRPGNPGRFFPKFLQNHPEIRSLVIRNASDFQLTGPKLGNILHGLPQLKRLCLDSGKAAPARQAVDFHIQGKPEILATRNRLAQLSVVSYAIHAPVAALISLNTESLEVLDLVNTGLYVSNSIFRSDINPLVLPNLKKLRIIEGQKHPKGPSVEMPPIEVVGRHLLPLYGTH
jgi:hypothetical protein